MWKTTATLYGHNLGCDEPPSETRMVTHIFQLEQELNDWQSLLSQPLFLRTPSCLPTAGVPDSPIIERFRVVLTLRYLNVQLLLHRPVLTASLDSCAQQPSPLLSTQKSVDQMQMNFKRTCVRVAEEIIEIIYRILTTPSLGRHLLGAWWFTLYYSKPWMDLSFFRPQASLLGWFGRLTYMLKHLTPPWLYLETCSSR